MPRFRIRIGWLAAIFVLTAGASAVHALPTAAQIRTAFSAMDTTGNAALNTDEWDRASFALFRAADKNKNDVIDADELQASTIAQDTFLHADTNHDGRLSISEFSELRRALFQIADIDHDDNLVYVEYQLLILMEQVGWNDQNHNGRIELSELRESLKKAFEQLDADHDGKLTAAEAAYLSATELKNLDKNGDSQITVDEFVAGYRAALLGG
jgi:Ca2+-binding EF-hand superfamily protein